MPLKIRARGFHILGIIPSKLCLDRKETSDCVRLLLSKIMKILIIKKKTTKYPALIEINDVEYDF
jgi:hypothetical protein